MSSLQQAFERYDLVTEAQQIQLLLVFYLCRAFELKHPLAAEPESGQALLHHCQKLQTDHFQWLNDCGQRLRSQFLDHDPLHMERADMAIHPCIHQHHALLADLVTALGEWTEEKPPQSNIPCSVVIFGGSETNARSRFDYASKMIPSKNIQQLITLGGDRALWPTEDYLSVFLSEENPYERTFLKEQLLSDNHWLNQGLSKAQSRTALMTLWQKRIKRWPTEHDLMRALAQDYFQDQQNTAIHINASKQRLTDGRLRRPTTYTTLLALQQSPTFNKAHDLYFVSSQPHVRSQNMDVQAIFKNQPSQTIGQGYRFISMP